jgi:putative ABC transport system substrate-binding protein
VLQVEYAVDAPAARAAAARMKSAGFDVYAVASTLAARELVPVAGGTPVVFWGVADPWAARLVKPGAPVTGFTLHPHVAAGKWLDLLDDAAPGTRRIVALMSPDNVAAAGWQRSMADACKLAGVELAWPAPRSHAELDRALAEAAAAPGTAVIALQDRFLAREDNAELLAAYARRVPILSGLGSAAARGALVSFEVDPLDLARRAGAYAGRLLRGESIGRLPVRPPTAYLLSVNRKTERALRLQLSQALVDEADVVLE